MDTQKEKDIALLVRDKAIQILAILYCIKIKRVYIADLSIFKLFWKGTIFKIHSAKELKVVVRWGQEPVAVYRWWVNPFSMISVDSKKQKSHSITLETIWNSS